MEEENKLVFSKQNYLLMLASIFVVFLGFFIMTLETAEYGFGFLGLTLGPIVVLSGFGVGFLAIFYKSKKQ